MSPGDVRHPRVRHGSFRNDPRLLLATPAPAPLRSNDNLGLHAQDVLTCAPKDVLSQPSNRLYEDSGTPLTLGLGLRADDRPWSGLAPPDSRLCYAPDRKVQHPAAHLQGLRGILQVDGYAGYRALAGAGQVELAFCWSHVRRRFYEIAAAGSAPIAAEPSR